VNPAIHHAGRNLRAVIGRFLFAAAAIALPLAPAAAGAAAPAAISEQYATVNGARLHYKIAGKGPAILLLHGYAETGHMWLPLVPLLATNHTVIVPDLRGAGRSQRTEAGYEKVNLAADVHELVRQLGIDKVQVVGHDIGLMVAYAYAAKYPAQTSKVVLMDAFLPGIGNWKDVWLLRDLWHFHFRGPTAEALVKGRERVYFEHFWNDFAADPKKSLSEADRRFYAREYARDGGMRAGFQYFKAFEQDAADFAALGKTKLTMPMMVLTGEKASGTVLIEQAKLVAEQVDGRVIPGSGHWLMEEARPVVMPMLVDFLNKP
jgi:pimeloyl-ACP methyl ester carboxylesterase